MIVHNGDEQRGFGGAPATSGGFRAVAGAGMSGGFGDLHSSLESMTFGQLLLAFVAFISYAIAQGQLVGARGRVKAWCLAFGSVIGFCALGHDWMAAAMLVAFALVGLGLFSAIVWAMSASMGLRRRTGASLVGDAVDGRSEPADTADPAATAAGAADEPAARGAPHTTPALPSL